jgi:hypothetical protein
MFAVGGQYTNDRGWRGTWLVTEPGVVKVGNNYSQYLILPDGSFYRHWVHDPHSITGHQERWGKVCN